MQSIVHCARPLPESADACYSAGFNVMRASPAREPVWWGLPAITVIRSSSVGIFWTFFNSFPLCFSLNFAWVTHQIFKMLNAIEGEKGSEGKRRAMGGWQHKQEAFPPPTATSFGFLHLHGIDKALSLSLSLPLFLSLSLHLFPPPCRRGEGSIREDCRDWCPVNMHDRRHLV